MMTSPRESPKALTLKDVAKATGFSATTVSAAFSVRPDKRYRESTLREVRAAAEKLGFRVNRQARLLRGGRSQTLLLVKSLSLHQTVAEMTMAVQTEVGNNGYHLISSEMMPATNVQQIVNTIADFRIDGVILQNIHDRLLAPLIEECKRSRVQMVSIEGQQMENVPFFRSDYHVGFEKLFRHLKEMGSQQVGLVVIDCDRTNSGQWRTRCALEAFERFITQERGIKGEILELTSTPALGNMMETYFTPAYRLMRGVLERKTRPDAVVFLSDYFAIGALRACHEMGVSVPDEMMIAGCDHTAFGQNVCPTLTSLRLPYDAIGKAAVETLIAAIEGGAVDSSPLAFLPELLIGGSTQREAGSLDASLKRGGKSTRGAKQSRV